MIPQTQTILSTTRGDCYRTVIASIFEVPLESLPADLGLRRFLDPQGFRKWLRPWGFDYAIVEWGRPELKPDPWPGPAGAWHLLGGASPRYGNHATVGKDGKLVWDPHPTRAGLLPGYGNADVFLPLNAAAAELLRRPVRAALPGPVAQTGQEDGTPWGFIGLLAMMVGMGFLAGRRPAAVDT